MDGQSFEMQWIQHHGNMKTGSGPLILHGVSSQDDDDSLMRNSVVDGSGHDAGEFLVDANGDVPTEADIDQIAAENLIFMARDGQMVTEIIAAATDENGTVVVAASDGVPLNCVEQLEHDAGCVDAYGDEYDDTTPQMVTEEIITDDWVQHQGEERVEIPADQIIGSSSQVLLDIEVPLPTVQDEYTALRPYPCDFCSRRFRKKISLMNHMVAHKNDRPHLCKLCGSRFFRRSDLINHLKAHAESPNPPFDDVEFINFIEQEQHQKRHVNDHYYDQDWSLQPDSIVIPTKSSRKSHSTSGNSSSTSSNANATAVRGRVSRLKPKEERYDYVECQELQDATAAIQLSHANCQQEVEEEAEEQPQPPKIRFPIIDDSKPFVCQQCGLAFAREKALSSHSKNHRNESPFECNQCNEMFSDSNSLQEHQKTHQFEESNSEYDPAEADDTQTESESETLYGEFYCSECGVSFHRQDLLRRHFKTHNKRRTSGTTETENKDRHCCNTCGETFAEALALLAHAEIHARYPPFKCVLCGDSFFEEHTIKRHLHTMHSNEMTQNSCILCGKECRDRKALIKHAWDHSREKCHSCSKCGKNFHNKARLKRHMSSHRDKSVICDVCHEEFPDGRSLSNHRHSHSTSSSGKLFPCNECGKTFGSRSSQQIHVRIHTGERPYGCRFCWKAFADGGTLRKHERIHTGEKPYVCAVCPRAFNQRVVLREHIRSHHSGLDDKRGTYYCSVCTAEMNSSNDLMQHLIQHSDVNTARQRQPITGPRKYKRRRKLKPHEIARMRSEGKQNGNGSDIDISDFDMENVEGLLCEAETTSTTTTTTTAKKDGKRRKDSKNSRNTNKNFTAGGTSGESVDEVDGTTSRDRRNSVSSNSDRLWQTKLINSTSNEESFKSLLSNLENTLQTIESLVVDNQMNDHEHEENNVKSLRSSVGTSQRNQQAHHAKGGSKHSTDVNVSSASARTRKKVEKTSKSARPRMIHTQKCRETSTEGTKKRSKTYITRTNTASLELLGKSSNLVDDYEIISPATQPPNQISSSPLHIKQEPHHHRLSRQHHTSLSSQESNTSRNGDLYDAQLLLDASALRKEALDKFNPSIVNDLEEILRSPLKSEKSERRRFTSESSTQFLGEQLEEEQHMIKIEPTSPDLREIVTGSISNSNDDLGGNVDMERRSTRSTRHRLATANRKYLEFETELGAAMNSSAITQKRDSAGMNKTKTTSKQRKDTSMPVKASQSSSYLVYTIDNYNTVSTNSTVNSVPSSTSANTASAFSIAEVTETGSNDLNASNSGTVPIPHQERKQRFFECEMCSAVFPDRAQLLDHVPIHI